MRQKMFLIGFQLLLLAAFSVLISLQIKSLKDDELPNDFNRDADVIHRITCRNDCPQW